MPWNDNANPGPWGSPPPGEDRGDDAQKDDPPGRREDTRRRPPPPPPPRGGMSLADVLRRLNESLSRLAAGPGGRGVSPRVLWWGAGAVAVIWLLTGWYTVQPSEEAVVTRFGAYDRVVGPGFHYHMPGPIERVETVPVTAQNKVDIGTEPDAGLMLTGDENIVDLQFTVQWHVSDPVAYLFNVREPKDTVIAVAESAMREVVGHNELQPILTSGRGAVQAEAVALMQRILNDYKSGIIVDGVQINGSNPPPDVIPSYQDIAKAGQDAQSAINEANAYRNKKVNEATGQASQIKQQAEGYKQQVIFDAQGQASAFNQVYAQYRRAPAVTRERLYIEMMQNVLAHSNRVIVDTHGGTAPIVLPPDIFRPKGAPTPPAQAQPEADQ